MQPAGPAPTMMTLRDAADDGQLVSTMARNAVFTTPDASHRRSRGARDEKRGNDVGFRFSTSSYSRSKRVVGSADSLVLLLGADLSLGSLGGSHCVRFGDEEVEGEREKSSGLCAGAWAG